MAKTDRYGMAYAQLSKLTAGSRIELDGGMSCCNAGIVEVKYDDVSGFYFECSQGKHWLDGQLDNDGDTLIGIYPAS